MQSNLGKIRDARIVAMETAPKRPVVSRFIELDGLSLHLREVGHGRAPLILLHGLGGDSTSWTLNQRALSADRPVISLDLPGHGKSARDVGEGTVPWLGAFLTRLPDRLGIDRFHLLGLSYGAAVAMDLAERIGDRILSLTCVSATGLGHEVNIDFIQGYLRAETPEAMRPCLELLFHDTRKINDAMVGYALFGRADPSYRACVRKITDANFENGGQRYNYRDALGRFPFPVHVIWGREDRIVPVAHADGLPPDVRVDILERAGHMPNAEASERFNRLVVGRIAAAEGGC
jgi:pyruvate dehydrogenase E2 component (dihydrolipoamide acetyltransferase)